MEDQSLINKIQSLQSIKPAKQWQERTELMILGHKPRIWDSVSLPNFNNIMQPRYAFALGLLFIAIMGTLAFGMLPNKNIDLATYSYAGLRNDLGKDKNTAYYLDYATKNLAMLKEGKVDTAEAVQTIKLALEKAQAKMPVRPSSAKESATIVSKITDLQNGLNETRAVLGSDADTIAAGVDNVKQSTKTIIEREIYRLQAEDAIKDLENSTLTEDQLKMLEEAKGLYSVGKYAEALEKIFELSNNK